MLAIPAPSHIGQASEVPAREGGGVTEHRWLGRGVIGRCHHGQRPPSGQSRASVLSKRDARVSSMDEEQTARAALADRPGVPLLRMLGGRYL